jgi:cytochrome c oxidase cbb3-type subunit 4
MFKQHIQSMSGIQDGYLIFSLIVFFLFFVGVLWWTFTADKSYIKDMEDKPFEN